MCCNFLPDKPIGREVNYMLEEYKRFNLRRSYQPNKLEFDKSNYLRMFSEPCLARDLDNIFCQQFQMNPITGIFQLPAGFQKEASKEKVDKLAKLHAVRDERNAPEGYREEIRAKVEFYKLHDIKKEFTIDD